MPTNVNPPPALNRYATVAGVALMTLIGAGVVAKFYKQTPTVAIRSENVIEAKSSSGSGFRCDGYGSCAMSGSLTVDGVAISTGSVVTQTNADARYVNTSGDTMTGALTVNVTGGNQSTIGINVKQVLSGATIQSTKRCPATFEFSAASGSAIATGSGTSYPSLTVPPSASGLILVSASAKARTRGVTGTTRIKAYNHTKGKNPFFGNPIRLEPTSFVSTGSYTITATNNISGGDEIVIYVPTVTTTAPTGVNVTLNFDCQ